MLGVELCSPSSSTHCPQKLYPECLMPVPSHFAHLDNFTQSSSACNSSHRSSSGVLVPQLCLTLCDPAVVSDSLWPRGRLPGSSVPGILQARILEWVVIPFSRGSSWPRDRTWVSCISCIGRWVLYCRVTWEAPLMPSLTVYEGRASGEVIKVKRGHKDGALIQ